MEGLRVFGLRGLANSRDLARVSLICRSFRPIIWRSSCTPGPVTANELKLDYFHIYDVGNKSAAGDVLLRGQFDVRRQKLRLALLDYFANPVSKNAEPIYDSHAHLTWYVGVQPSEPVRAVILETSNTSGSRRNAGRRSSRNSGRTRTRRREFLPSAQSGMRR